MDGKWKWHNMIYSLIQELNISETKTYKMNYISTLNWLSFFKERTQIIENKNKI
jgi:hypothetical protein